MIKLLTSNSRDLNLAKREVIHSSQSNKDKTAFLRFAARKFSRFTPSKCRRNAETPVKEIKRILIEKAKNSISLSQKKNERREGNLVTVIDLTDNEFNKNATERFTTDTACEQKQ